METLVQSRSKACATCITRKTKCDKLQPACSECQKSGWPCPGYVKVWKQRPMKGGKARPRYDREWLPGQEQPPEPLQSRSRALKVAIQSKSTSKSASPPSANLFALCESPLLVQLIYHLDDSKPSGVQINNLGTFFPFIPERLGHCKALDDAVQCICTTYSSLLGSRNAVIFPDRREYSRALRSLRLACQDKDEVLSSNVLCAAILLSWYEILADNLDDSWIIHVGGVSTLVQLRGPSRHAVGFDHALLKAEHGPMVIDSFLKRKPSFLDSNPWLAILNMSPPFSTPRSTAINPINQTLAKLSTILSTLDTLTPLSDSENETKQAIFELCLLRQDLKERFDGNLAAKKQEIHTPILCCKDANYLLMIDTTLLRLLCSHVLATDSLPLILNTFLPASAGIFSSPPQPPSSLTLPIFTHFLEDEIWRHLDIFKDQLVHARKATPFSARKMSFLCRIMCQDWDEKLGKQRHRVWREFERAVEGDGGAWLG